MKTVDIFATRFFNRLDAYYIWDDYLGRFVARRKSVTPGLVQAHLNHEITLSVPALSVNGYCLWCGWDSDDDSDDLDRIEKVLIDLDWHPLREAKRPGRQGHLWLFFNISVRATDLRLFDKAIRKRVGLSKSEDRLEFFPKQDNIANDGMGNGLRLPLGKNKKPKASGAVGWFEGCGQKTIQSQLDWFAAQPLNPGERIAEIAHMFRLEEAARAIKPRRKKSHGTYEGEIDFKEIAREALLHAKSVVEHWLPGGRGKTNYLVLNPQRADNHIGSFSINLRKGYWKDFATNDSGGDLISLVAYVGGCSQLDAAKQLAGFVHYKAAGQ